MRSVVVKCIKGIITIHSLYPYKIYIIIFFLILTIKSVTATTIVTIYKNGVLTMGADSKLVGRNPVRNITTIMETCKIIQIGKFFYAVSGISSDSTNNFIISNVAKSSLLGIDNLGIAVEKFEKNMFSALQEYFKKWTDLDWFFDMFPDKETFVIKIAIVGIDKNIPIYYQLIYSIPKNRKPIDKRIQIDIIKEVHPSQTSSKNAIFVIGKDDKIWEFVNSNIGYVKSADSIHLIRQLINMQIHHTPESCGGPIDILQLTDDGAQWIERKPKCYQYDIK